MTGNPRFSNNVFECLGVLTSLAGMSPLFKEFEAYAIEHIQKSTIRFRGALQFVSDYSIEEAKKDLNLLDQIMPLMLELKNNIGKSNTSSIEPVNIAIDEFLQTLDLLRLHLREATEVHYSFDISHDVLAEDWASEDDEHWNNY